MIAKTSAHLLGGGELLAGFFGLPGVVGDLGFKGCHPVARSVSRIRDGAPIVLALSEPEFHSAHLRLHRQPRS